VATAKVGVDVVAGVLPGTPEPEYTRQWFITGDEWELAGRDEDRQNQARLLADMNGKAMAWAHYLMLQPDRLNWVKTEWVWF
jgi:hypothetical protein